MLHGAELSGAIEEEEQATFHLLSWTRRFQTRTRGTD
ncbi:hypothetical protein SLEP1_g56237 [Rubroshorea leprosula]|uniref:Uncharacterized protein n=1 Tax=Rubroshorea leprosula TaxID=152421 RepID=A0AAV5MHW7_9ROSI|nr:hypothetical protein SLEP1_g56237 [Rubroshorea leprosula]